MRSIGEAILSPKRTEGGATVSRLRNAKPQPCLYKATTPEGGISISPPRASYILSAWPSSLNDKVCDCDCPGKASSLSKLAATACRLDTMILLILGAPFELEPDPFNYHLLSRGKLDSFDRIGTKSACSYSAVAGIC